MNISLVPVHLGVFFKAFDVRICQTAFEKNKKLASTGAPLSTG